MKEDWVKRHRSISFVASMLLALGLGLAGEANAAAEARDWPSRPIRVIVPFAPGGGADLIARVVGPRLSERLGQTVVVDNRPAANGILGAELAAHAAPDGYTLFVPTSNHAAIPSLYAKLSYDLLRDFAPITHALSSPLVMAIHPSLPAQNLKDFIAYARANRGKINFGHSGVGSPPHLAGVLLNSMAGIDMTFVVYKGIGPALTGVLGNEVQITTANILAVQGHIRSGRLRALGITSLKRSQAAPDWPTISEEGLPGYEAGIWFGFLAPAKTPRPIVDRLNKEITAILNRPEVRQTLVAQGGDVVASTQQEFGKLMRDDIARLAKLMRAAGIKAE